ncbi:MAG TPA: amidase [Ktedonobacterales bacterium]
MPTSDAQLLTKSATDLAAMIRSGDISAVELIDATLRQIEANSDINAFTLVDADGAREAARAVKPGDARPFAGVPIAIKELNAVAGQPLTMGSDILGDYLAPSDMYTIRRLREAGFILVGRTSAPEFGIVPVTEPRRFGPTRNPWNTDRTPGGSSGGAAAAVAAGMLPLAHGSDGAGSLRIPAACCGLVGHKASRGRISAGPDAGDSPLSTQGALTRTVMESALLLDILSGYELGDATWAPDPEEPFAVTAGKPPRTLRIAFTTETPISGVEVHPEHVRAVEDAAKTLEALGHHVERFTPAIWNMDQLMEAFLALYGSGVGSGVNWAAAVTQRRPSPELVEPLTWAFYQHGARVSGPDLIAAQVGLQGHSRAFLQLFRSFDAFMTPTLAARPIPVGSLNTMTEDGLSEFRKAVAFTPFTAVYNVTGQPAISLPVGQGADGLPLAVQIAGKPLADGELLALAAQVEAALPWSGRLPERLR